MTLEDHVAACISEAPKGSPYWPEGPAFITFRSSLTDDAELATAARTRMNRLNSSGVRDRCYLSRREADLIKAALGE